MRGKAASLIRKSIRATTMVTSNLRPSCLGLCMVLLTGCSLYSGKKMYWTNFAWQTLSEDSIMSMVDSTRLPLLRGYQAIIYSDSEYFYIKNNLDFTMSYFIPGTNEKGIENGRIAFNEEGYFQMSNSFSYDDDRWMIALAQFDNRNRREGDCIGYNKKTVLVVSADIEKYYNYNLEPVAKVPGLKCTMKAPY